MMRNQTLLLLAAAAFGLAVGQASAADLPRRAPAYVPPAPPPYVWTGCYVGANVGGAWAHLKVTDVTNGVEASRSNGGFAGGGQIGCDYQMGVWVVGIRNMFDGTSISRSTTFFDPGLFGGSGTVDGHVRWFDTLTGRVGYLVQPNLLFYARVARRGHKRISRFSTVPARKLANSPGIRPAGRSVAASNGCSCRTGRSFLNTTSWALAREA